MVMEDWPLFPDQVRLYYCPFDTASVSQGIILAFPSMNLINEVTVKLTQMQIPGPIYSKNRSFGFVGERDFGIYILMNQR